MVNVLVTGVGAVIGYGIINCLKKSKYKTFIVGTDIYDDAYGQYICDKFIKAVPAKDEKYLEFIKKIITDYNIDLVMFGTEQEIDRLANAKNEMGELYSKLVINKKTILELSQDKWLTYEFLTKHNLTAIPSKIDGDFEQNAKELGLPFLLKPRKSYASKGIEKIYTKEDFEYYKNKSGVDFMVQKIIGDTEHEYTSAVFGFGDGSHTSPITLKRKLSGEGATAKAEVVKIEDLNKIITKYCEILKPLGPTNFQFRKDKDTWYLLEINPRISSSTSIRAAFGYNEPQMCVDYFVNKQKPQIDEIKKGKAVRYIADCIIYK